MNIRRVEIGLLCGAFLGAALLLSPGQSQALTGDEPTFSYRIPSGVMFDPLPIQAQRFVQDTTMPVPVPGVTPVVPPATQNTITTTAPVSSNTTISVGTIAGQVLTWVATVFGTTIGTVVTLWVVRLFKLVGIQITDAMSQRLQFIITDGLNKAAKQEADNLQGKAPVEIKNAIVASAVTYVQQHGADELKQLGVDPYNNAAIDLIKARIQTAIADPAQPTPAVLDPAKPAVAA